MEPAHYGADGNLETGGGFGIGEAVDVDQLDDAPERFVELGQRLFDGRVEGCPHRNIGTVGACRGGEPVVGLVAVSEELGSTATVAVDVGVAEDREQPGPGC